MKKNIISIVNHKGGVGKTTTVVSLGAALANTGKKVLLIDLDPQCNLTDSLGGKMVGNRTIYEALEDQKGLPIYKVSERLDLCPGSLNLLDMDMKYHASEDRSFRLKNLIKGARYDYVLIDCPPSLGLLTVNAFAASYDVIIPLTAEVLPLRGIKTLLKAIDESRNGLNKRLELLGILITKFNRRNINKLVENMLREQFGELVFRTRIRENIDLAEAPLREQDIFRYAPKSNGATDYSDLANEVLKLRP